MPSYITQLELTDKMPLTEIVKACADKDALQTPAEIWTAICDSVSEEIDGLLAPKYAHPFPAPIHPRIKTAARWFTLETLYVRRGVYGEANPATTKADAERKALRDIGTGKVLLDAAGPFPAAPAAAITSAASTEEMTTKSAVAGRSLF